jgi:hypothetical protein
MPITAPLLVHPGLEKLRALRFPYAPSAGQEMNFMRGPGFAGVKGLTETLGVENISYAIGELLTAIHEDMQRIVAGVKVDTTIKTVIDLGIAGQLRIEGLTPALVTLGKLELLQQHWSEIGASPKVKKALNGVYRHIAREAQRIAEEVLNERIYNQVSKRSEGRLLQTVKWAEGQKQKIRERVLGRLWGSSHASLLVELGFGGSRRRQKYEAMLSGRASIDRRGKEWVRKKGGGWIHNEPMVGGGRGMFAPLSYGKDYADWLDDVSVLQRLSQLAEGLGVGLESDYFYHEPTGLLKAAVMSGMKAVDDQGALISVDETVFLQGMDGTGRKPVYWMAVETGHRSVFPTFGGKLREGPYVAGRPYWNEIKRRVEEYVDKVVMPKLSDALGVQLGDMVLSVVNTDAAYHGGWASPVHKPKIDLSEGDTWEKGRDLVSDTIITTWEKPRGGV